MFSRVLATVAVAAFILAIAPAAGHAGPCDESFLWCDPIGHDTTIPAPAQARLVATVVDVKDTPEARALYERLVPPPFLVPPKPQVALQLVEAEFPQMLHPDYPITRFMEGPITLKALAPDGRTEGWFHISEPTNSASAYDLGRGVGLPKVYADMHLRPEGAGWHGNASILGRSVLDLRWAAASVAVPDDTSDWAFLREPFWSVQPPLTGPDPYLTKFTPKPLAPVADVLVGAGLGKLGKLVPKVPSVTSLPPGKPGLVSYAIDPDIDRQDEDPRTGPLPDLFGPGESLADLVEPTGVAPGMFWDVPRGIVIIQTASVK